MNWPADRVRVVAVWAIREITPTDRERVCKRLPRLPADWSERPGTVANKDGFIEGRAVTRQVLVTPRIVKSEPSTRKAAQR